MFKTLKNFIANGRTDHKQQAKSDTVREAADSNVNTNTNNMNITTSDMNIMDTYPLSNDTDLTIPGTSSKPYDYNEFEPALQQVQIQEQSTAVPVATNIPVINLPPTSETRKDNNPFPGLENYQITEKLGEGAFSTVHQALNLQTNEHVAIKVIKKQQLDQNQKQAVLKEATIMRQLSHDNIVKFVEFREVDQYYYIIQELIQGGEIFNEIVKFTYLSEDLSRHIIKQVGEALKYLHEEIGVVHRDLKPENLLFQPIPIIPSKVRKLRRSDDPNKLDEGEFNNGVGGGGIGIVKLADFGLSKQIWYDNTKTPCGTVGYTAPEIVKDEHYSKNVDMWALGCVLYTLLCGFPPFYDEKIDLLTRKVARGEYTFLSPWWDEISVGAKTCVKNLLTVDPNKRYTIDQFLSDPWLNEVQFKQPKKNYVSQFKRAEPLYSPMHRAMKDAFDISNAVQRIGEENILKQYQHNHPHDSDILEEEDEDEDDDSGKPQRKIVKKAQLNNIKDPVVGDSPFELSLGTSTILSRRRKKEVTV
ncbi:hypothetical protein WICPIJ_002581 [Wickerhamomyces pijperi]|uniref:Protein kinase domain-containing protein n=1 Tax=Wickerhamomyces pijperi TaxID=599730 RepID=A0A9P8Q8M8_WICPI|nr:hypothetical protein WICPIJ_002581 [Wickerhamomyces pijperi]